MAKEKKPTLIGIDNIRPVVGNASYVTILKWKREYPSFPIRRLGGIWVGDREQIASWFALYSNGEDVEKLFRKNRKKAS